MSILQEINAEIKRIREKIEEIKMQPMSLPADIMIAYQTQRVQFLRAIHRPMSQEEVEAVLDAMAGQIELNEQSYRVIELMAKVCEIQSERFVKITLIAKGLAEEEA